MVSGIEKYLTVYLVSMFKFLVGPTLGTAMGLSPIETIIATVLGMMTSVIIISFFGPRLRQWLNKTFNKDQKLFTKRSRKFVTFWRRYGLFGIAFLTPVFFSPILGSLLVNAFEGSKPKIIGYMLFSAIFWAIALSKALSFIPDLFE